MAAERERKTWASSCTPNPRGIVAKPKLPIALTLQSATTRPSAPPITNSTRLSMINWRNNRPRLAPSAERTASSRSRADRGAREQVGDVGAADEQ